MKGKKHTPEQIIQKLRRAEVEIAQGATVAQAAKKIEVTEHTYYRWRAEYGGLRLDQAKRLKELERENALPRIIVSNYEQEDAYEIEFDDGRTLVQNQ